MVITRLRCASAHSNSISGHYECPLNNSDASIKNKFEDFIHYNTSNKCYGHNIEGEHTTWEQAREICRSFTDYDGVPYDLVVFETEEEAKEVLMDYKAEVQMFNSEEIKYEDQLGTGEIGLDVKQLRIRIQHINQISEMVA